MPELSRPLKFADCLFRISSEDAELVAAMNSMFLSADSSQSGDAADSTLCTIAIENESAPLITENESARQLYCAARVINQLYKQHQGCIWLDAACFRSPDGRLTLIAGPSASGKTTLALAMAFKYGWRLMSEDITLVDPSDNKLLITAGPSGIRSGTLERLRIFAALPASTPTSEAWLFDPSIYMQDSVDARFDLAISLQPIGNARDQFDSQQLSPADFLRKVLPNSNLVRSGLIEPFERTIRSARCFAVSGGELDRRMQFIRDTLAKLDGNEA